MIPFHHKMGQSSPHTSAETGERLFRLNIKKAPNGIMLYCTECYTSGMHVQCTVPYGRRIKGLLRVLSTVVKAII